MDKLFNSPFMIKFQEFGQRLGKNKFLSALQASMMSLMGVIMVGAISQIICAVGSSMLHLFEADSQIYGILFTPYHFTMNMLSLWLVGLLAFNYARNLGLSTPAIAAVEALCSFMLLVAPITVAESGASMLDMSYFGPTGMFVGFVVAFIAVRIDKLCADKEIYIHMPEVVPQFLQDGFAGIVPLAINIVLMLIVSTAVSVATAGAFTAASGFLALLSVPLGALTSVPGMFVLGIVGAVLWCFGIHGTMIIFPIIMPLLVQASTANAAAMAAGEPLVFYPVLLFAGLSFCGGTGNTMPLVLMSMRAKSEQLRAVAKAGIIPGWFNINEPVTFGAPIMYNPILCIPYVLNVPVNMLFLYFGYKTGLIIPAWITLTATLPMGFGPYLTTLNFMNGLWPYLAMIPVGLVWYPFFKAYDKQFYAKEQEALAAESEA